MLGIKNRETLEIYILGDDFKSYQNLKYLPLASYPSNSQSALIMYCLDGEAKITVHEDVHWIQPEELIILLPEQFVLFSEPSEGFSIAMVVIPASLLSDVLSSVPRFSPHLFFYIRTHYWYPQLERDIPRVYNYLGMIEGKVTSQDIYRRELVTHLLRYLYPKLSNAYQKESTLMIAYRGARKKELANKFFGLIMKHFKENKDVAFYADKLCTTSKYLIIAIKKISGKSAKDWIVGYIILGIKVLLKDTSLNIQETVAKTSSTNQSSLGRFFRRHIGMPLSQYRVDSLEQQCGQLPHDR